MGVGRSVARNEEERAGERESEAIPYDRWTPRLAELKAQFLAAQPYPHILLESFLDPALATQIADSFPSPDSDTWVRYQHYNERTLGKTNRDEFPEPVRQLMDELLAPRFREFLGQLTGTVDLHGDPSFEGAGLHMTSRGGFLRVHSDFTHHNRKPQWRRRYNFILFLNPQWRAEWGGSLELWNRDVSTCVQQYLPSFNRALIFETTSTSFHGYPDAISPPEGTARKSITSYYYTLDIDGREAPRSTHYIVRPGEKGNRFLVAADNVLLATYARVKRVTGISDKFTGRVLSFFSRDKRK